jgi:ATP-dependent protease ClpP protease subunit
MFNNARHFLTDIEYKTNLAGYHEPRRLTVETVDNHIYFYADVDSDRCLALMREIREVDSTLRSEYLSRGMEGMPATPIWLHIHSYGGSLFSGFSVADQLTMIKSPIYSVVEGICASAATLIAAACTKRYILPNSFMLIHQLSSFMWGTHEQFKDEMTLQSKAMDRLVEFYAKHSKLSADEIRTMLTRDFWIDAETCIKHGFVDEIMR